MIIAVLYALNLLWMKTLYPIFMLLPIKEVFAAIIEGVVRTGILLAFGTAATYYWKISPEVNSIILKVLKKKTI